MERKRIGRMVAILVAVAAAATLVVQPGARGYDDEVGDVERLDFPQEEQADDGPGTIFIYDRDSGTAAIGTMDAGVFDQVQVLNVDAGWTHAAASANTLLLYNTETGQAQTGRLRGGIYVPVRNFYAGGGWTHLVASGDSYLFYDTRSGYREWGTLQDGISTQTEFGCCFSTGWDHISASSDTIRFLDNQTKTIVVGSLADGWFFQKSATNYYRATRFYHAASNRDGYLNIGGVVRTNELTYGEWGAAYSGFVTEGGYSYDYFRDHWFWTIVEGVGDTIVFYSSGRPEARTAVLKDGAFRWTGYRYPFQAGWDMMAGTK